MYLQRAPYNNDTTYILFQSTRAMPTKPITPIALIGTFVAFASPDVSVGPQSILGVDLTGTKTPCNELSLAALVAVLVAVTFSPEFLLALPVPAVVAVPSIGGASVTPPVPPAVAVSSTGGASVVLISLRSMLTALSSALILLWYSVGSVSSQAGGVSAVKALSIINAGSPVVEA
jgi:hypothetical protein